MQDRLAETERLKKECVAKTVAAVAIAPTRSVFDGICNVKVLTASDMDPNRLGRGVVRHKIVPRPMDLKCGGEDAGNSDAVFNTIIEPPSPNPVESKPQSQNGERAFSLDSGAGAGAAAAFNAAIETRFLTDSATITIPIGSTSSPVQLVNPPKYKTMPSPTRANTILPTGAMCLNEIYEEGTDIGSSDTSTTTTPRPIARHTNFINQRSSSAHQSGSNGSGSPGTAGAHAHRRNKFHKSRTASCSSSDDDDSENRKKRAHKIVDSTKPFQTQRRDSNDDSSDSQDPSGNPACGGAGGSGAAGFTMLTGNGNETEPTDDHDQQPNADDTDSTHTNDSSNSNGRQQQKNIQGFRRHRTGRRRTGETRLRESQSLNRITEVQESEMPAMNTLQMPNRSPAALSTGAIDQDNPQSPTSSTHSSVLLSTTTTSQPTHKASKLGFGARLLQGFKKSDSNSKGGHHHHEPKTKHHNNNNHKNNSNNNNDWNGGNGGGNGTHISSADSNETLHWIKHSKPPLRVKAHQRLKNLKCLVDIFS